MAAVTATSEAGRTWSLTYASHLCTVHELAPVGGERHCNLAIFRDPGKTSIAGMQDYKNARLTHLSIHASRPNQVEIYLSIVQRKALTPTTFADLDALSPRLMTFGEYYCQITRPSESVFTHAKLDVPPARSADREPHLRLAASRPEFPAACTRIRR
ncbi:hypothetical protein AB0C90_24375 [Streptomyces sp. NPDC048550]|uniref:hypothetical protein n=1 Tax=Streptomyces sp. NPDC048550 TaxID=3155739 RepID=UPI0034221EDA